MRMQRHECTASIAPAGGRPGPLYRHIAEARRLRQGRAGIDLFACPTDTRCGTGRTAP